MNKKALKSVIGLFIIFVLGCGGFSFFEYNKINEIRTKLTDVKSSESYYNSVNDSIDKIIDIGKINQAHKKWVNDFIMENIFVKDMGDSFYYLNIKLENKNIKLDGIQKNLIQQEFISILQKSVIRKEDVDKTIEIYKEMRKNQIDVFFEELFFDKELDFNDIKYY